MYMYIERGRIRVENLSVTQEHTCTRTLRERERVIALLSWDAACIREGVSIRT